MENAHAITVPAYTTLWAIFFLVAGAVIYILDRKYGRHIYRVFYNWTHENVMPADQDRGSIYNQSTKMRMTWAFIISTAQSLMFIGIDANPMIEFLMWFLEAPIMLAGFYLGPLAYRFWERRDRVFAVIDKVEKGEPIGTAAREAREGFDAADQQPVTADGPTVPVTDEQPEEELEDPRGGLNRFTRRD